MANFQHDGELLDNVLQCAADTYGDIGPVVMQHFYTRHPGALECFEDHALGNRPGLEASMIDSTLYCIMHLLERPVEIRLILADQLPHHYETLQVELAWFRGLIQSMIEILGSALPAEAVSEQALCRRIADEFDLQLDKAATYIRHRGRQ